MVRRRCRRRPHHARRSIPVGPVVQARGRPRAPRHSWAPPAGGGRPPRPCGVSPPSGTSQQRPPARPRRPTVSNGAETIGSSGGWRHDEGRRGRGRNGERCKSGRSCRECATRRLNIDCGDWWHSTNPPRDAGRSTAPENRKSVFVVLRQHAFAASSGAPS